MNDLPFSYQVSDIEEESADECLSDLIRFIRNNFISHSIRNKNPHFGTAINQYLRSHILFPSRIRSAE